MATLQLKDGRWIVYYRDPEKRGKIRREYFGKGLEGEKRARDRDDELFPPFDRLKAGGRSRRPTKPKQSPIFADMARAYLLAKQADLPAVSIKNMGYKFRIILKELGLAPVYGLSAHRMDQYVAKRMAPTWKKINGKRRQVPGVKRTTVHREISDIQAILNWAITREYIKHNPLAGYKKPVRDDAVIQPPTRAEAAAILAEAPDHLIRALVLSYYTGLRPGNRELFSLSWSAVDWDLKTIHVISAKKGARTYRIIPIHDQFLDLIRTWYRQDGQQDGPIIHYRAKPIRTIKTAFATAKKKAGITRKLPPYAFRHAFATYVLGQGGDLKSTSEILGHSRTDTTTRIYQHTDLNLHRKAINKLPSLEIP